jgi:hypothetical protein
MRKQTVSLGLLQLAALTGRNEPVPYLLLQENIMKVFSGVYLKESVERIFISHLCRTHRMLGKCIRDHFLSFPNTTETSAICILLKLNLL